MTPTSFARRTGLVAFGQAVTKSSQLLIAVILVRLLAERAWNDTALLLSVYIAGTTIGTLGVHHALLYLLPRSSIADQRTLVLRATGLLLAVGSVGTIALAIGAGVTADTADGVVLWTLLGVAITLELPSACFSTSWIATERFVAAAVWDLAGTIVLIGAVTLPVVVGGKSTGVVIGLVASGAVRLFAGTVATLQRGASRTTSILPAIAPSTPNRAVELLVFGIPLGLAVSVSMLNRLVDKWCIALFRPSEIGVYSVVAQEIPVLAVLPYAGGAALASALVCAFRDGDVAQARTHWLHLTSRMSTIVVPIGVVIALVAPELLAIGFGARFVDASLPLRLFTLVAIHRVAEYGLVLRAAGRTRALLAVALLTLTANLLLAAPGAYLGGMTGAALGTFVATGIGWLFALHQIANVLQVSMSGAFAWLAWTACVLIAGVAAVLVELTIGQFDMAHWPSLVCKVTVFVALFGGGLWVRRRCRVTTRQRARWVPEAHATAGALGGMR